MTGQDYVPAYPHLTTKLPCVAGAAITAGQLVEVSAGTLTLGGADNQFESSPLTSGFASVTVIPTTAATPLKVGVAAQTVPSGSPLTVYFGGVHVLGTAGSVTAGDQVTAAASGGVADIGTPTTVAQVMESIGWALSANASNFVEVLLK